jgi:amino acid transporter
VPRFDAQLLAFPSEELQWNNIGRLALGLGAAMHIAVYDYLGYYNVCHLGDEVRNPGRTIPRAVIGSVFIVASIYLVMNIAIIGVIPWQEVIQSQRIGADFMEHIYGRGVAEAFAWLIIWTAGASVFALTLGYSRIPYAAARAGDFFSVFAKLHPTGRYPIVSLLSVGGLTAVCCFFPLGIVIDVAVTARILIQFIGQIAALHILRKTRPEIPLPFRMKLYPLPSLIALVGWIYVLATSELRVLAFALGGTLLGVPAFIVWQMWSSSRTTTRDGLPRR